LQRQWACYEKGLSLLAMREHTRQELRFKLIQKGFSSEQARPRSPGL
jgi:SOS response regulatory protein OraA/RecX